ncbi:MAG: M20/M25/M40 family metallo-hydrolase [Actinobacteria bacterium]|nr:M20/M25/M40 family metallo-hydrolase [Actinomycetota bacterium]
MSLDYFSFPYFEVMGPGRLKLEGRPRFEEGTDYRAMIYSAPGRVSGPLVSVSFDQPEDACGFEAFGAVAPGDIVLVRPGPCFFRELVINAQRAGAGAVLLSNPDFTEATGVLRPSLISPDGIEIPAFVLSNEAGIELNGSSGAITINSPVRTEQRMTPNLIAESPEGDVDQVVMAGGHLDSVIDGPGINDNGSGTATLLEIAEEMAGMDLDNKVRFAFWSAEEVGLLGSTHYVESLGPDLADVAAYLNFDMIASPNFVRYVYDDTGAPEGSDQIRDFFRAYFAAEDLPLEDLDIQGRSDHGPFLRNGIPVGGLFTGADMIKTAAEVESYGGVQGANEDPCYHRACDDTDNINTEVLDEMADAIAALLLELTMRSDPLH